MFSPKYFAPESRQLSSLCTTTQLEMDADKKLAHFFHAAIKGLCQMDLLLPTLAFEWRRATNYGERGV
jgi:hypothetical protein